MNQKISVEVDCAYCGTTLLRQPCRFKKVQNQYCNLQCWGMMRRSPIVSIICETCEQPFDVKECELRLDRRDGPRRWCSKSCAAAFRCGDLSSSYNGGKIELICHICGLSFYVIQSRRDTAKYCSVACSNVGVAKTNASAVSSIEVAVANELDHRGISYIHQGSVGPYVPDFVIGQTIIEVDGDYWHNLPRVIERDIRKNILYQNEGYKIIRIWEHEVNDGDFSKLDLISA